MRKSRLVALSSLAILLVLPSLASANCYSVYDTKNQLAFQSTIAPVDLSARISDGMRARFPGGHLIMVPDDRDCREYRCGARSCRRASRPAAPSASTEQPDRADARSVARSCERQRRRQRRPADAPKPARNGNRLTIKRP